MRFEEVRHDVPPEADLRPDRPGRHAAVLRPAGRHRSEATRGEALLVFHNGRRTHLKILWHDGSGYLLLFKRLDRLRFRLPMAIPAGSASVEVEARELSLRLRAPPRGHPRRRPEGYPSTTNRRQRSDQRRAKAETRPPKTPCGNKPPRHRRTLRTARGEVLRREGMEAGHEEVSERIAYRPRRHVRFRKVREKWVRCDEEGRWLEQPRLFPNGRSQIGWPMRVWSHPSSSLDLEHRTGWNGASRRRILCSWPSGGGPRLLPVTDGPAPRVAASDRTARDARNEPGVMVQPDRCSRGPHRPHRLGGRGQEHGRHGRADRVRRHRGVPFRLHLSSGWLRVHPWGRQQKRDRLQPAR